MPDDILVGRVLASSRIAFAVKYSDSIPMQEIETINQVFANGRTSGNENI
jgi:hypothetical protein